MSQLMKAIGILGVTAFLLIAAGYTDDAEASSARRSAEAEQVQLDQACEDARQRVLAVERVDLIEECVANKFPRDDLAGCERFYADHGNATAGGRAPLHMDLPECLAAHDHRQGR